MKIFVIGVLGKVTKDLKKETGRVGNWLTSRVHPFDGMSEKSPGDLR